MNDVPFHNIGLGGTIDTGDTMKDPIIFALYHSILEILPEFYTIRPHRVFHAESGTDILSIQHDSKNYRWEVSTDNATVFITYRPKQTSVLATHSFILAELANPNSLDSICGVITRLLTGQCGLRRKSHIDALDELMQASLSYDYKSDQIHMLLRNVIHDRTE